jgi:hypothetical protein
VSAERDNETALRLAELEPGALPLPVFLEVARLTVTPVVEFMPLRTSPRGVEVLLLEREESDPVWGGLLHTPGTVVRASDSEGSFTDASARLVDGELAGTRLAGEPVFVETLLHRVRRGTELAHVYYVEVAGSPARGVFEQVASLPERVVESQRAFIVRAAACYAAALPRSAR